MLSDAIYKFFSRTNRTLVNAGISKYSWNTSKRLYEEHRKPSEIRWKTIIFNNAILILGIVFNACQLIRLYILGAYNRSVFVFTIFNALMVALVAFSICIWNANRFFEMHNAQLIFLRYIHRNFAVHFIPKECKYVTIVHILLVSSFYLHLVLILSTSAFYLTFYYYPFMPGSVLPLTWYFIPVNFLLPGYISLPCYLATFSVLQLVIISGGFLIPLIASEFVLSKKSYTASSKLRQVKNLPKTYRAFQMLVGRFNEVTGIYLIPIQALLTLVFVFSSFVLIRRRDELNTISLILMIGWAIGCPSVWIACLLTGGYLFAKGNKILKSWKKYEWGNERDRKQMAKFRVSCYPIMACYGHTIVIRKTSVLVFSRGLVRGLMRALLTFRE